MKRLLGTLTAIFLAGPLCAQNPVDFQEPYTFNPPGYVCYRAPMSVTIDGDIDGDEWKNTPWTHDFMDIQGTNRLETPRFRCRAKLMWDDQYLYIAAEMEEPHLWATYTERESVIFHENDFEVFLDVTGTTHHYIEYEVNALGTEWDLMIVKPYRDGAPPLNAWNLNGLKSAVKLYGTINDPSDTDERWTLEMAIPIATLKEIVGGGQVKDGEQWRMNFSRVEWHLDIVNGKYVKRPKTPEDNWVWAPTGKINIHEPEYWGYLQFSTLTAGKGTTSFTRHKNEDVKWALRKLYYRQRAFAHANQRWATTPEELKADEIRVEGLNGWKPEIHVAGNSYKIIAPGFDGTTWFIRNDGYVGRER